MSNSSVANQVQSIINSGYMLLQQFRDLPTPGKHPSSFSYSVVIPHATYSPWLGDQDFLHAWGLIQQHTLVDMYRMYELWTLCESTQGLEGDVLEVGVWRGGSTVLMGKRLQSLGIPITVFGADTFSGVVKAGSADPSYSGGEHADTSLDIVKELARTAGVSNITWLQGIFPDETGHGLNDRAFRLVHIDVDVYQSALDVLEWAWPRLCVGGVVVFDDYGFESCQGVTRLVEQYRGSLDRLILHNLNGHALMVKTRL